MCFFHFQTQGSSAVWRLCQRNGHIFAFDRVANAAGLHSIQGNAHEGDRISVSLWGILDWKKLEKDGPWQWVFW